MKRLSVTCIPVVALMFLGAVAFGPGSKTALDHSVAATTTLNPSTAPQGGGLEYNTNRPGSDYKDYDLSRADPEQCRSDCANDPTCRAFTYVKPGVQGPNAHCWLKGSIPDAVSNECCISGIKPGAIGSGSLEYNINRPGSDYKNYELSQADPAQCRNDCANDPNCRAFTYVKPTVQGTNAHCWLKNSVPEPVASDCCLSGVKAGGGGGGGSAGRNPGGTGREGCQAADYSLSVEPGTVRTGQPVTFRFASRGRLRDRDWIAVYPVGKDAHSYVIWNYANDHTDTCSWTYAAPAPGQYEVAFLLDNGYDVMARASLTVVY